MDVDDLPGLEAALWDTSTRGDREWMNAHLSAEFIEFGRSGHTYSRDSILNLPIGTIDATLSGLTIRSLGHDVALVTYLSVSAGMAANRSSIWRASGGQWQLEFHQGTPTVA